MERESLLRKEDFEIFESQEIKKIIFIGGNDTGKTTLIKEVANYLVDKNRDILIFDCDIGQSHIGPPTTIGFVKLKQKIDDFYLEAERFYFVGAVSPSFAVIEFLTGVSKLGQFLNNRECKILIDTTGYINCKLAISLKIYKIETLVPDFVFLLEREKELQEIEQYLKNTSIKYSKIKVENIFSKSIEERFLYRKTRFLQYFKDLSSIFLNLEKISVKTTLLPNIVSIENIKNLDLRGNICSLRDEFSNDICLGIIKGLKNWEIEILIPKISVPQYKIKGINISNFNIKEYFDF